MSPELWALLLVGLGVYLLVTGLPLGDARAPLAERLRRFDVDVLMTERRPTPTTARRLLPWLPADAVLRPLLEDLAGPVRQLLGGSRWFGAELEEQLRLLRPGTTAVAFVAQQLLLGAATTLVAVTSLLVVGLAAPQALLVAAVLGLLGFLWPQARLRAEGAARRRRIGSELPQVAWLLAVARSAGLGLDAAVDSVARSSVGPLGQGLLRAQAQVGGGLSLVDALERLAERERVPELTGLVSRLRATDELGLPLVQALEDFATSVQEKAVHQLLEKGEKGSLKALLPLGLGMLPVSIAVTVTPGILVVLHLVGP